MHGPPRITEADRAAMAEIGLRQEHLSREPEHTELWSCNADAVLMFDAMISQWRTGPGGAIGLDYSVLPIVARLLRMSRRALREAFDGLRVMEAEALTLFAERAREQRR